jgi:hypothetical protein
MNHPFYAAFAVANQAEGDVIAMTGCSGGLLTEQDVVSLA